MAASTGAYVNGLGPHTIFVPSPSRYKSSPLSDLRLSSVQHYYLTSSPDLRARSGAEKGERASELGRGLDLKAMACIAAQGMVKPSTVQVYVQKPPSAPWGIESVRLRGSMLVPAFAGSSMKNARVKLTLHASRKTEGIGRRHAVAAAAIVGGDAQQPKNAAKFRISETFTNLRKESKVAFIPYVTAGDPDLETTVAAVKLLESHGADIIELGVPYSDPLADGAVLQAAANRAISGGTNLDSVLTMMREGLSDVKVPLVLFVYYNPLLRRGIAQFLKEAKAAGASGFVVPDLPIEETTLLRTLTSAAGLELVLLTTPTTPTERVTAITEASQGFVYLVSLTGVTGTRTSLQDRVEGLLKDIKKVSDKPVSVGFGVSTPEQAAKLREWGADGVIIGSAVVKLLGESGTPEAGLNALRDFAREVRSALTPE